MKVYKASIAIDDFTSSIMHIVEYHFCAKFLNHDEYCLDTS